MGWLGMVIVLLALTSGGQSQSEDGAAMQDLKRSLNPPGWSHQDYCQWAKVSCENGRVTRIQIGGLGLTGTLPPSLNNLTELQIFEVFQNSIAGPVPTLSGLTKLQRIMLRDNRFTSIPPDLFDGMISLTTVILDNNPNLSPWTIPHSLSTASLNVFSAVSTNLGGPLPPFFFSGSLQVLKLSFNSLQGGLPPSVPDSCPLTLLWLNSLQLNGTVAAIQNMTNLKEAWLHRNSFSGQLPDFSRLGNLVNLSLANNRFSGPVPQSLLNLPSLFMVNLTNNKLQGPSPKFATSVTVDLYDKNTGPGTNSFCLQNPGTACDTRVDSLLLVARDLGYPDQLAGNWHGNDPCVSSWLGITCQNGSIVVVNFNNMGLTGTISPSFSSMPMLQKIILSNNNLTGTIPPQLADLTNLQLLDVSNNQLIGKVPPFRNNDVTVITTGNVNFGMDPPPPPPPPPGNSSATTSSGKKKSSTGTILGSVVGVGAAVVFAALLVLFIRRSKRKRVPASSALVVHPDHSTSDQDTVKITIVASTAGGTTRESHSQGSNEIHVVETNGFRFEIEVLRRLTENFSEENVLGRGGFATVYKGVMDDDDKTIIAVKRMESGVLTDKGLTDFQSEMELVKKVRHRHLVALLGYCLDAGERIFVYEYMSQGALSKHLFDWKEEQLKPLDWMKRLIIALDVARGVEYLHSLAQHIFIHRDLKPANILLGDGLRAKVADFGLIKLVPDGKASVATKLAGTFGYLSPEYAVMGRVTTKLDVYSFGVILMELISGRKSLDDTLPAESSHLVTWFRRVLINKELHKVIDPTIELNEETLASLHKVAELAGHCCANEPHQRPDMSHAVNVLSSLTEIWKPSETDPDDPYGINYDMPLPKAESRSSVEGSSNFGSNDNTQTSIATRPSGFAESFTSSDGR